MSTLAAPLDRARTLDPRPRLVESDMSGLQVAVIALAILLQAVDGFCVLSVSFAAPGIAADFAVSAGRLGLVLSMDLIGMALGAIVIGGAADTFGRRLTTIGSLAVTAAGMLAAVRAGSAVELSIIRLLTGFGIGGLVTCANALAAEFSNARRLNLCVAFAAIGYPAGAFLGGIVVAKLLQAHGWHAIFYFGAGVTAVFIPLVLLFVPESVHWLVQKRPAGAVERINRILPRMGHAPIDGLPPLQQQDSKRGKGTIADLFSPGLVTTTVLLTLGYIFQVMTTFFILKWTTKIVVNMGFTPAEAATVFVWGNLGGVLGGVVLGFMSIRFPIRRLTMAMMVLSAAAVILFGSSPPDLFRLSLTCALAEFFTNAAIAGMYPLFSRGFPTHVRAFGTGFAVGTGRAVSTLGSVMTGVLFGAGFSLPIVAAIMAGGSLLAAVTLWGLKIPATAIP